MNELDLIKLNIYEAYDNNEITYGEKEYLLEQVDVLYEDAYSRKMRKLNKSDHDKYIRLAQQMKDKGLDPTYVDYDAFGNHGKPNRRYSIFMDPTSINPMVDTNPEELYWDEDRGIKGRMIKVDKNSKDKLFSDFQSDHNRNAYNSFRANRKKLQETNDKLAKKDPNMKPLNTKGPVKFKEYNHENKQDIDKSNNKNNNINKAALIGAGAAAGLGAAYVIKKKLDAKKKKKEEEAKKAMKESTFDTLLESINDLYDED